MLSIINFILALLCAPLLLGIINKTKAFFAGRKGAPWLQPYHDLYKLMRKGAVYSVSTSWLVKAGAIVALAGPLLALSLVPLGRVPALINFSGDFILMAYALGLSRLFLVLAALDTGSSFEGMGASREVQFAVFAEPALFLGLAALAYNAHSLSMSTVFLNITTTTWLQHGIALGLILAAFLAVFFVENCRIPVDDPNTHLELTMIHEAMILDHGGVDLGFIMYGAALKLWVLGTLVINLLFTTQLGNAWLEMLLSFACMLGLAVFVGIVESTMARLRLLRVPRLLVGALVLSGLAFVVLLG